MLPGEYQDRPCRSALSVASFHQFRIGLTDRSKRLAGRRGICHVAGWLHGLGLVRIGRGLALLP